MTRRQTVRRIDPGEPGIRRFRAGAGRFRYRHDGGSRIGQSERERIEKLAIPPAWTDVWISGDARGHIQAVGRDEAGRRQYIYHEEWRRRQDESKFDRALDLAAALPAARRWVSRDLHGGVFDRDRALAVAFRILDLGAVRIGNEEYLRRYGSRGVTTMRCRDLAVDGSIVTLEFPSKGGVRWTSSLTDAQLADYFHEMLGRRGANARAIAWRDSRWHPITTAEVNEYVRLRTGVDATAKDFRTLRGTIAAAESLSRTGPQQASRAADAAVREAIRSCAEVLGNTPAVAKASYIDPRIFDLYRAGTVMSRRGSALTALRALLEPAAAHTSR